MAFGRRAHTVVPDTLTFYKNGSKKELKAFRVFGFNRSLIDTDGLIRGMFEQPVKRSLPLAESSHSQFFAGNCSKRRGHSLNALDFGRGQEAGLCSLVYYIEKAAKALNFTMDPILSFDDLLQRGLYPSEIVEAAKELYTSVDQIPVYFANFASRPSPSLPLTVGFSSCEEFRRIKAGDRYFYEWSLDNSNLKVNIGRNTTFIKNNFYFRDFDLCKHAKYESCVGNRNQFG